MMITALVTICLVLSVGTPVLFAAAVADAWSKAEMGEPGDAQAKLLKLNLLPDGKKYPANFNCEDKSSPCHFQLAYFLGSGFDLSKKQRRNILYIPGGPGALVDSESRSAALRLLEKKHNVVYFHPRGMAQSAIDGRKEYDQFLRAEYVVEDIEKLRQAVLETRPWDAIYAHSWGTVIAQRYAAKYGRPKDPIPKVMSLILSGPVDRHRSDTQDARTRMSVENLRAIFSYYRSQGSAHCQCASSSFLKPIVTDYSNPQITILDNRLGPSDNFCFLTSEIVARVAKQLENIVPEIEKNFGSADFVVDHFSVLKKNPSFQERFGKFPIEFFAALRYLQMSGAPEKNALVFVADSRNRINAALLIAHYLTAESPSRCRSKDPLAIAAAPDCEYCERFRAARDELRMRMSGRESQRGNYVYGVYDGVARWISTVTGEKECFSGKDMEKFAAQPGEDKRFARDQVKRIGIVAEEKICPWNPADYPHEVATLLLKGNRDTVVAGCQAEDFYKNGIRAGGGTLLEFRGLGHDFSVGNLYFGADPSIWSKRFAGLLEDFMRLSSNPAQFRSDAQVVAKLRQLKATDRSRDPNLMADCGK
jgi:pimeloyl-ACP methyl ester carboxylesterase